MSLRYILLSKLTDNTAVGPDNLSIQKRYRSLSMIYLNLLQIFIFFLYLLLGLLIIPVPGQIVPVFCVPLMILSLIFLKMGRITIAAAVLLSSFHLGIFKILWRGLYKKKNKSKRPNVKERSRYFTRTRSLYKY